MTPEAEAKLREVAAEATAQTPAVVVLDPLSIRDFLTELDAARAENARLRTALEKITTVPPTNWDGWGEVDRLRDIARAALKGT